MSERSRRCLELLLYAATALLGGWLLLRFALPALAPFLLAFALAALMEPAVHALCRLRVRRTAAAGFTTIAFLSLLLFVSARLTARGMTAVNDWIGMLPELAAAMEERLDALERWLEQQSQTIPGGAAVLERAIEALGEALGAIPGALSRRLLDTAALLAQRSGDLLLFVFTAGLGSFFLSAAFPQVKAFLRAQLPRRWLHQLQIVSQDLKQSFGGFLRAQALLAVITFAELLLAFWLLGLRSAFLTAALTTLVDALPVFGVGAVLVPWAAIALLRGQTQLGIGLLVSFLIVSLLRNLLQAKLLGDQIGLDPLSSLLAVYAGWRLCGFWGLLLFPLLLVTLKQLHERGLLRLWRSA